jgi:hypothetical protein
MGMVASHHVTDDLGARAVLGVGGEVLLPHRVQDAALYGFEAVADVGQRARRDDRQRVVQIPRLRGLVQRDAVRGAAGWRWRAAAGWRRSVGDRRVKERTSRTFGPKGMPRQNCGRATRDGAPAGTSYLTGSAAGCRGMFAP